MKSIFLCLVGLWWGAAPLMSLESPSELAAESPLTAAEQALPFSKSYLRTDEAGHGLVVIHGEPLSQARLLVLSPWDLLSVVQTLSGSQLPLRRFGNGDALTQAWRERLAHFAASADAHPKPAPEDLFDPDLVLWDPGYIQHKNEWGQWTIQLANREIVQGDLPTLSPLEVQQAVEVLTARSYPLEFVLEHLEAFRAQLSVVPRE